MDIQEIERLLDEYKKYSKIADDADVEYSHRYQKIYEEKHEKVVDKLNEIAECLKVCAEKLGEPEMWANARFGSDPKRMVLFPTYVIRIYCVKSDIQFILGNGNEGNNEGYREASTLDSTEPLVRLLVETWTRDNVEQHLMESITQQIAHKIEAKKCVPKFWEEELQRIQNA